MGFDPLYLEAKMKVIKITSMILFFALFLSACTTEAQTTENTTGDTVATVSADGYQDVALTYGKSGHRYSYNYILTPSEVKVGIPVRITGDVSRLNGCYRTVTISQYNVRKTLSSSDNTVEFTPTETGDITISCSMGMATTKLTVI